VSIIPTRLQMPQSKKSGMISERTICMNIVKKSVSILLVFILLVATSAQVLANQNSTTDEISVYVNDTKISFDVSPIFVKSRTMVPIRGVFEALGAKVDWDNYTQTVTITRGTEVRVQPGNRVAMVDNSPYIMDVPAVGIDGRILVPVRFIGEAIGANVDWVNKTKTVFINDIVEQKEIGNILNGGKFAADNAYNYFISPDGVLIRENIMTKVMEKIADNIFYDLHILNDWIYCIGRDKGENKVIRIKKNGSEREVVVNKPVNSMQVSNDWIYYSDINNKTLYRTNLDGSQTHKIIENGYFLEKNWFIQNGWIYYVNKDAQAISRVRVDGSDIRNITNKLISPISTDASNLYRLKIIDKNSLYFAIYSNITDINRKQYSPGLYSYSLEDGDITKIADKIPLAVNMDDEWLYLTVQNFENTYSLMRCKKDGTEVFTINEYKKNDIPQDIYINNSSIYYTLMRGEETPNELLFYMNSYGEGVQQYDWVYGRDFYAVQDLISKTATAHRTLNSYQTTKNYSLESQEGTTNITYEVSINRSRDLFYQKQSIDENNALEIWLDKEQLYSKQTQETLWNISTVSKYEANMFKNQIFDYIQSSKELCNNLSLNENETYYILSGTGAFPILMSNISGVLGLDEDLIYDLIHLELKIDKQKKYIEELDIYITYNSQVQENGDRKQYTNHYQFINSNFNTIYLNIPYSVNQTIRAMVDADKYTEQGIQKYNEGKFEEAIQLFDTAIATYNRASKAYLNKGNALYELGKYKEAILSINQYHELNPSDTDVFALLGNCYLKMGNLVKAEELGKETLKHNLRSVRAYDLLGTVSLLNEEYSTAVEYFQKALSLDNNNYSSHMNLVTTLYRMGNYTQCINMIDNYIRYFSYDRDMLYMKAQSLLNQGKPNQAIRVYEQILDRNPANDFVTMTYIAREYENLQNYAKASEYAERAKAIYPDYHLLKYLIDNISYDLSTTGSQKLVDFIKKNYLYYEKNQEIENIFNEIIKKGNIFSIEDAKILVDKVKGDDKLSRFISGLDYDYFINNYSRYKNVKQDENHVYVKIDDFHISTGVQFTEFILNIQNPEDKTLIIDLRDNSCGLSDEVSKILDALLPECNPGYIIDRDGYITMYSSGKWHTSFKKIGILVNENTASSAELLTLSLKTFADNVTIIGKKTAGEGVGQVVYIDRNRGFAIYLVNHYWNVLNENIDGKGINPDIFVDENDPDYTKAIDNFLKN